MKQLLIAFILSTCMIQGVFAQNINIQGVVKDAKNQEAIEFVNVVLQTADSVFTDGAASDSRGHFSLSAPAPGSYRLNVSSLGYAAQSFMLDIKEHITLADILMEDVAVALDNVTVSASNLSSSIDKKLIFPSELQVKASTNGIDLLQQLMLPKLMVNPLFNEVSLPGGGELQYRINGVKVEIQDVIALLPADIIRIEFHDNPGLRYGNAEVVLDYIVRRPETGGSIGLNLYDGAAYTKWGNNNVNGRINHKKSEFSVNYDISHRDFYEVWRDNEEQFTFADGRTMRRKEAGEPGHLEMYWQHLNTTYSFHNGNKIFNATLRYYTQNRSHNDYKGTLYNMADPSDAVRMADLSSDKTHRPALDLYYQQNFKNEQTLVFNVVGTYNYTANTRIYNESRGGIQVTDVNNLVTGHKYSWIGEAIYEKKAGANRISAGLRHNQSFSDNTYTNELRYDTKMDQGESSAYAEFKGKAGKLDYTLGMSAMRAYFSQAGDDYDYYTLNPRIVIHYTLPGRSFIRLRSEMSRMAPSLSNLSDVSMTIDSLQIQRGNPALKPFLRSFSELTYEFQKGIFYSNLTGIYEYRPDAIMDEKYLEGDNIIQTWNNQKSWQRLSSRLTLRAGPIKDIFQLSVTGGVNHYLSQGNTYRHSYTNWYTFAEGSATYKGFTAALGMETSWNWFYGETMDGGENIHYAMLGYKYKDLSFSLGMFNPFADNYRVDTENRSQYASYKKSHYINESSRMVVLRLTYNFSFGRTFKAGERRLNNADEDSGVMSAGK
ncbi:MAG: outer membrane beta-barrel protein [Tannerellaceae bacterium]|jgi:hypothetical protein|nr:outer membrane beta-barrel protein [Tannerellaceae bacterium]